MSKPILYGRRTVRVSLKEFPRYLGIATVKVGVLMWDSLYSLRLAHSNLDGFETITSEAEDTMAFFDPSRICRMGTADKGLYWLDNNRLGDIHIACNMHIADSSRNNYATLMHECFHAALHGARGSGFWNYGWRKSNYQHELEEATVRLAENIFRKVRFAADDIIDKKIGRHHD